MARSDTYGFGDKSYAEAGRLGGIKSGEAKRRKKAMRDSLEILLGMKLKTGAECDIEAVKNFAALKGKNITVEQAMLIAQIQKALKGDTQALTFLRDTSGQKPDDTMILSGNMQVQSPYDELTVDELKELAKQCEKTESDRD